MLFQYVLNHLPLPLYPKSQGYAGNACHHGYFFYSFAAPKCLFLSTRVVWPLWCSRLWRSLWGGYRTRTDRCQLNLAGGLFRRNVLWKCCFLGSWWMKGTVNWRHCWDQAIMGTTGHWPHNLNFLLLNLSTVIQAHFPGCRTGQASKSKYVCMYVAALCDNACMLLLRYVLKIQQRFISLLINFISLYHPQTEPFFIIYISRNTLQFMSLKLFIKPWLPHKQ